MRFDFWWKSGPLWPRKVAIKIWGFSPGKVFLSLPHFAAAPVSSQTVAAIFYA
jgi:hypothetical protein